MSQIVSFFSRFGLLAMFLCILLEYGCFPVSSEIVLPLSGAAAAAQNTPFLLMLLLSVLAGLIGTSFCFLVGRIGGKRILDRIAKRFPKTKEPLRASLQTFEKYGIWAVGIGRVIPICRTYIAFVAGASSQPYSKFVLASLVGISVWNTLLVGFGYFLKNNWYLVASLYGQYKHLLLLVLIVLLSLHLLRSVLIKE